MAVPRLLKRCSFVTTPIFYVNAAPHIGHLYSAVLADALHRWNVLKGADSAIFCTGTDEHGIKVQKAALAAGMEPRAYCDMASQKFKDLFNKSNIRYTDYIRTTEERHLTAVKHFWNTLLNGGHITMGTYEGWYSVTDEAFIPDREVAGMKESGQTLEWSSEKNYIFQLEPLRERLNYWLNQNPSPVYPSLAQSQVQRWIDETLPDVSVSRPCSRLHWGIPVPSDPTQTIYVWLDALVNYLTVGGYPSEGFTWPATVHIVGKDILRFHAVFWPAFLMAAGLDPPDQVISHCHWMIDHFKMSKSRGNVVDPFRALDHFGVDQLRYFLLKEGSLHHDGDYSERRLATLLNADLSDTLGNLLLRAIGHRVHPGNGNVTFSPKFLELSSARGFLKEDQLFLENLTSLVEHVSSCYDDCEFSKGISLIMEQLHQTNRFIDRHKPWQLIKQSVHRQLLESVLFISLESIRLCAVLLWPVMPSSMEATLERLGLNQIPTKMDFANKLGNCDNEVMWISNIKLAKEKSEFIIFHKFSSI